MSAGHHFKGIRPQFLSKVFCQFDLTIERVFLANIAAGLALTTVDIFDVDRKSAARVSNRWLSSIPATPDIYDVNVRPTKRSTLLEKHLNANFI